jgi:DNA modification methylase
MITNQIIQGDCLEKLKELPDESINCVMTSPPYWALRDYGVEGQLGLEPTFEQYINDLCNIFDEVKRVLRKDGTCWVNIGDTYFGSGKGAGGDITNSKQVWGFENKEKKTCQHCKKEFEGYAFQQFCGPACSGVDNTPRWWRPSRNEYLKAGIIKDCLYCGKEIKGKPNSQFCDRTCLNKMGNDFRGQRRLLPDKCLTLIPMRFVIEMINRGWILRNTIIWHKPNCMPSSAKDRFTVDFEYIFFFTKSKKYWFETQYEPHKYLEKEMKRKDFFDKIYYGGQQIPMRGKNRYGRKRSDDFNPQGRNKRAVWEIPTQPFGDYYCEECDNFGKPFNKVEKEGYFGGEDKSEIICQECRKPLIESHFAIYPEAICETPIKAGCPEFVCNKCGKARERNIVARGDNIGKSWHDHSNDLQKGMTGRGGIPKGKYWREDRGLSDCGCNAGFSGGIVLDPFFGAGTTGVVAIKQNKKFIGIELNPEYIEIAKARLKPYLEQEKLKL